ncbi:Exosome complex component RRP43 [Camellia lanceoleosa]|uniref:Exosome complex component RRP43 n=1 Tax=Camellia lanceoleosa TaxID=1840588 RepID=A0ACC0G8R9_9ERIC|nr:Exosome complex component RRP43 [Camellia lanceoleosa]
MSSANASGDLSSEMEVDAFRRLFSLRFHERHLLESVRPNARKLGKARDTTLAFGVIASVDGSALAKIAKKVLVFCVVLLSWTLKYFVFVQTMLAAIKMEVMTPTTESPDKGCRG